MCQVSPDNVSMLTAFGTLFFGGGVVSLMVGSTYCRGVIARDDNPVGYWVAVVGLLVIGGMCLYGVAVCPRG